jgi:hypothetical protein
LDVLRLQYLFGVAEICIALSSAHFLFHFHNSYGPVEFTEVETIHPLYTQQSTKNLDMFKGAKKLAKLLLFLLTDSVFCCFEHLFESQDDFFSFLIFCEYWQLNILSGNLVPNFIWGFLSSTHIIFMPSNVIHSRKEMENNLW